MASGAFESAPLASFGFFDFDFFFAGFAGSAIGPISGLDGGGELCIEAEIEAFEFVKSCRRCIGKRSFTTRDVGVCSVLTKPCGTLSLFDLELSGAIGRSGISENVVKVDGAGDAIVDTRAPKT